MSENIDTNEKLMARLGAMGAGPAGKAVYPGERMDALRAIPEEFVNGKIPKIAVPEWVGGQFRADGAETAFIARNLEQIRPMLAEVKYQALKAQTFIPWGITPIGHGKTSFTVNVMDVVGQVQPVRGFATDAPLVDFKVTSVNQTMESFRLGWGISMQEARAALDANVPLGTKRAELASSLLARYADTNALLGDTTMGVKGLFNATGTDTYTVPATGAAASTKVEDKRADDVLLDMKAPAAQIYSNTKEVEVATNVILPTSIMNHLDLRRVGDGTSMSLLAYIKANQSQNLPALSYDSSPYLESNTGWTGRRVVTYKKDPENLEFLVSVWLEQLPPVNKGWIVINDLHMRIGGLGLMLPKSVCYSDNQ